MTLKLGSTRSLAQANTEFITGYFSTHDRRRKTELAYSSDLAQFSAFAGSDTDILSLSGTLIEEWAAHLRQEGYSPASIRRKMVSLRVFCGYWVRKGTLPESPFWRVRLSYGRIEQLPRTLTESEIRALLSQARRNYSNIEDAQRHDGIGDHLVASSPTYRELRNLAIVDLLFATGARVGEASSLDTSDYRVEEAAFRIQGKGGRDRMAFVVDSESIRIQRDHLRARQLICTESPALFLNASSSRISTQGITNIIAQLRKEAGIARHVTPHMLRHTVATLLLRNGVDIRVVQEFLGHASIATTQRYTHITKEHLVTALRTHHPSLTMGPGRRSR